MSEERWRRFTWMPGDLVIVGKDEDEPKSKPKAKRKPKPKPET
ncbi:hypothetical protein [Aquabacter sp. L1I39]|nr:hypothetical protein [Aquabacter sp. L1I39]